MSDDLKHIAIVMDGNGRWAKKRGLPRSMGHKEGLNTAKKITKAVSDLGIPYITLYVFSTENWKRTESEVGFLMGLIKQHLRAELKFYADNNIRIEHIGNLYGLPQDIQNEIATVKAQTANYTGTAIVLAINYGSQNEIIRAIRKINPDELSTISEELFDSKLDTGKIPPVDLLIRTGGEKRLSNFLLWQSAYAELYFTDTLWPDWTAEDLYEAIEDYKKRNRRYGNA
ncbi:polyprenyl diphosphate synthase [Treponema putidum]|uniref:Isoprenyl transferase n=1 Tax=Treponema putidum TaxID=221027 RepID=A0AAE9MSJ7_9SPIR|nr:polyprenyl diphosphate synthase [Treponema putidum]AIN92719.1 UDP diphosphate synthase [Treponema putidum]TWI75275.1 undecaprenyl diphosphate synthase [Treponema putidum]UTY28958.1 di-trans,poly-cis-decaprenylcistransferase [Treponema putidum]UTY31370.1 di-trans,poly-cis-decaprenylcistransferase [Treponema putidum]UTY33809.1 di-trans,poly-cis-decaprenylcistransferase [Treponema putidum]